MVKTDGKAFKVFCSEYRKLRKAKNQKVLLQKELVKIAAARWTKLDAKTRKSYYSRSGNLNKASSPTKVKKVANGGKRQKKRPVSPTKQRAINRSYGKHSRKFYTPSPSQSRSMISGSRSMISGSTSGYTTDCTEYGLSTRTNTSLTSLTSQTSFDSCSTGRASYMTTDTSYDEDTQDSCYDEKYYDTLPDATCFEFQKVKAKPVDKVSADSCKKQKNSKSTATATVRRAAPALKKAIKAAAKKTTPVAKKATPKAQRKVTPTARKAPLSKVAKTTQIAKKDAQSFCEATHLADKAAISAGKQSKRKYIPAVEKTAAFSRPRRYPPYVAFDA